jgi:hypothetical protein
MRRTLHRRPSPSLIVAIIAVVMASAGSAVAARLITGKQIKNGTIQLADLSKSARQALQGGRGPQGTVGPAGAAGAAGQPGAKGDTGDPGRSALSPLRSGETIRGIVGGRFQNGGTANSPMAATASFPIPAPVALDNAHIEVAPTANCPGSTTNPTAAPGFVCIYPDIIVGANNISGNTGVSGTRTLGFQMEWNAITANAQASVRAEWAYTAP